MLSLFLRAREIKDKYRDEVFLCCSAILQNVSESHYRSGARNQLQGWLIFLSPCYMQEDSLFPSPQHIFFLIFS